MTLLKYDFVSQYTTGKLVTLRGTYNIILWSNELDNAVDHLFYGEVATILCEENRNGWIQLLSARGVVGYVHYINVKVII